MEFHFVASEKNDREISRSDVPPTENGFAEKSRNAIKSEDDVQLFSFLFDQKNFTCRQDAFFFSFPGSDENAFRCNEKCTFAFFKNRNSFRRRRLSLHDVACVCRS